MPRAERERKEGGENQEWDWENWSETEGDSPTFHPLLYAGELSKTFTRLR